MIIHKIYHRPIIWWNKDIQNSNSILLAVRLCNVWLTGPGACRPIVVFYISHKAEIVISKSSVKRPPVQHLSNTPHTVSSRRMSSVLTCWSKEGEVDFLTSVTTLWSNAKRCQFVQYACKQSSSTCSAWLTAAQYGCRRPPCWSPWTPLLSDESWPPTDHNPVTSQAVKWIHGSENRF